MSKPHKVSDLSLSLYIKYMDNYPLLSGVKIDTIGIRFNISKS